MHVDAKDLYPGLSVKAIHRTALADAGIADQMIDDGAVLVDEIDSRLSSRGLGDIADQIESRMQRRVLIDLVADSDQIRLSTSHYKNLGVTGHLERNRATDAPATTGDDSHMSGFHRFPFQILAARGTYSC